MNMQIKTRTLITLIIFFGLKINLSAQASTVAIPAANNPPSVRIGLKFTPTINWTNSIEGQMEGTGAPISYGFGIMADFNIANNPNYWISTELNVTNIINNIKATKPLYIDDKSLPIKQFNDVKIKYKTQMISIPVALKLRTNEIGKLHYYGQFGLAPGVAFENKAYVTAKEDFYKIMVSPDDNSHSPNSSKNDALDFNGDGTKNSSFNDDIVPIRMGLILGIGVEGKISGKTYFVAGLQFNNGLNDQFSDKNFKARSNFLALNLGVFF